MSEFYNAKNSLTLTIMDYKWEKNAAAAKSVAANVKGTKGRSKTTCKPTTCSAIGHVSSHHNIFSLPSFREIEVYFTKV